MLLASSLKGVQEADSRAKPNGPLFGLAPETLSVHEQIDTWTNSTSPCRACPCHGKDTFSTSPRSLISPSSGWRATTHFASTLYGPSARENRLRTGHDPLA